MCPVFKFAGDVEVRVPVDVFVAENDTMLMVPPNALELFKDIVPPILLLSACANHGGQLLNAADSSLVAAMGGQIIQAIVPLDSWE